MRGGAAILAILLLAGCAAPARTIHFETQPSGLADATAEASAHALRLIGQAQAPGGYALRVHDERAYVATFTTEEGISVFDVSDPTNPVHLGGTPPGFLARSVDILDYGDRLAVALSTGEKLEVWALTDPTDPFQLASFNFGSHNVVTLQGAKIIYNARNVWDGVGGAMEIVDASDPLDIQLATVYTFPPTAMDGSIVHNQGCHDFTVFEDVGRAYCAAYEQTLILDISTPLAPQILTTINNALITSHHTAFPILNHEVLVIGDEFADNFVWGCFAHPAPSLLPETPAGVLWFYDLTTPTPEVISYVGGPPAPPEPALLATVTNTFCTSHNGVELGEGTGLIAYGWFNGGMLLFDASQPAEPKLLDVKDIGGAFGDARWAQGKVFGVDDKLGLTVFDLV